MTGRIGGRVIASTPRSGFSIPRCLMKLSNSEVYEYQKIILAMNDLLDGKDQDIVIPAVISYLAAAGAFSGVEKKKFISFFVSQVDKAYEEFDRRQV
jgi:hypothetical protein